MRQALGVKGLQRGGHVGKDCAHDVWRGGMGTVTAG